MNALLINPWITDLKLYDEWMHPVGLYFLADLLEKNGCKTNIVNCMKKPLQNISRFNTGFFEREEIDKPEIYQTINKKYYRYGIPKTSLMSQLDTCDKPDFIFITSFMTYWVNGLIETIETVQNYFPHTQIIIGGISAILIPEFLKNRFPNVEIFQRQLFNEGNINFDCGISLKVAGTKLSLLTSFSKIKNIDHGPIITSLGCPMHCSYCASSIIQPNFTKREVTDIFDEILFLYKNHGVKNFSFYDDAFLVNKENLALPLLDKIIDTKIIANFHTPNGLHLKYIDKQIAQKMFIAGLKH